MRIVRLATADSALRCSSKGCRWVSRPTTATHPEAGLAVAKGAGICCIAVRGTLPDQRLTAADEIVDALDVALLERLLAP